MNNEDVKEILIKFIQEHYAQIRHNDTQRSTVSNLIVVIAAALLAFVTFDKTLSVSDLPLTLLLLVIGLFGAAFCLKYYERVSHNYQRLKIYRNELDELLFEKNLLEKLILKAKEQQEEIFPRLYNGNLSWIKVNRLWIVFHLFISLLGLILSILALLNINTTITAV